MSYNLNPNIQVTYNGTDVTDKVLSYHREHTMCDLVGVLKVQFRLNSGISFNHYDVIKVRDLSSSGFDGAYYVSEIVTDSKSISVSCGDGSQKLTDFFIDRNYSTSEIYGSEQDIYDPSCRTKNVIDFFAEMAGVTVNYTVINASGEIVNPNYSYGLTSALEIIIQMLQESGWYGYFDDNFVLQIVDETKSAEDSVATIPENKILSLKKIQHDKQLRNRVVVYGAGSVSYGGLINYNETRLTGYEYDSNDIRTVVVANGYINDLTVAQGLAQRVLDVLARPGEEYEVSFVPDHDSYSNIKVSNVVTFTSDFMSVSRLITDLSVDVNVGGVIATVLIGRVCPRIYGYYNYNDRYVYTSTLGDGVWRKRLHTNHAWTDFSAGLTDFYVHDLSLYNGKIAAVSKDGGAFVSITASPTWKKINTTVTSISGSIYTTAEENPNTIYPVSCAVSKEDAKIYVAYNTYKPNNDVFPPIAYPSIVYSSGTGPDLKSFIVETNVAGAILDSYQITCSGIVDTSELCNLSLSHDGDGLTGIYSAKSGTAAGIDYPTYNSIATWEWNTSNYSDTTSVGGVSVWQQSFASFKHGDYSYLLYNKLSNHALYLRIYNVADPDNITMTEYTVGTIGGVDYSGCLAHGVFPSGSKVNCLVYKTDGTNANVEVIAFDILAGTFSTVASSSRAMTLNEKPALSYGPIIYYDNNIVYNLDNETYGSILHTLLNVPGKTIPRLSACFNNRLFGLDFTYVRTSSTYTMTLSYCILTADLTGIIVDNLDYVMGTKPPTWTTNQWNTYDFVTHVTLPSFSFNKTDEIGSTIFFYDGRSVSSYFSRICARVEFDTKNLGVSIEDPGAPPDAVTSLSAEPPIMNNKLTNFAIKLIDNGFGMYNYPLIDKDSFALLDPPVNMLIGPNESYGYELSGGNFYPRFDFYDDGLFTTTVEYNPINGLYNLGIEKVPTTSYGEPARTFSARSAVPGLQSQPPTPTYVIHSFYENYMTTFANSTYVTMVLFGKLDPQFSQKFLLLKIKNKQAEIIDQYDYPYFVESSVDGFSTVYHPYSGWYLPPMSYDFYTDPNYKTVYPVVTSGESSHDARYTVLISGVSSEGTILTAADDLYRIKAVSSGVLSGEPWEVFLDADGISTVEASADTYPFIFTAASTASGVVVFYQRDGGNEETPEVTFIDRTTNHPQTRISKIRSE